MSQHPSLKINSAGKRHRNVLKRHERIKKLRDKEKWEDGENSVFGLPKVKSQKIQAKSGGGKKKEEEGAPAAADGSQEKK